MRRRAYRHPEILVAAIHTAHHLVSGSGPDSLDDSKHAGEGMHPMAKDRLWQGDEDERPATLWE